MQNEYTKHVFPLKFHEYMASGKPIVVSGLPEMEIYRELVQIADSPQSFLLGIEKALFNDTEANKVRRQEEARKNTWDIKARKMEGIVVNYL